MIYVPTTLRFNAQIRQLERSFLLLFYRHQTDAALCPGHNRCKQWFDIIVVLISVRQNGHIVELGKNCVLVIVVVQVIFIVELIEERPNLSPKVVRQFRSKRTVGHTVVGWSCRRFVVRLHMPSEVMLLRRQMLRKMLERVDRLDVVDHLHLKRSEFNAQRTPYGIYAASKDFRHLYERGARKFLEQRGNEHVVSTDSMRPDKVGRSGEILLEPVKCDAFKLTGINWCL